ncbi:PP2C family protein-serine/threonine phosphatase [Knoellia aerolata]|uniref:Magnesium or manganese-dependent protein phosphatase n=1 Tax=Knoellia aerolata DSM 18566 TaxID=1385519 RepID=A0A0A0JXA5_9MICO|nr:PP2C family protein-serine/threonine phosphatase [Knoellia aerolata]KGN42040.1 magnesium or manganese-dependent protein phosphatase [Knoellia aerolata DSM 18566]
MSDAVQPDQPLGRVLDAAEDASPLQAVEAVTEALADSLGASSAFFLIADLSGRALVRMSHDASEDQLASQGLGGREDVVRVDGGEQAVVVEFDHGPVAAALRTQRVQVLPPTPERPPGHPARWVVLVPVTERGEALGLLQLSLPAAPDASALAQMARIGHVLAFVVIANRRHTDLFEWAQRSATFSLPAEIQRRLLPAAFTCEAGAFTLSAWLEPAASVGGDTFDYSLGRDVLHLSLTDAMGHGVDSALTATLCVGSLRNTRREGGSLVEQAAAANAAMVDHAAASGAEGFATGMVGRVDLTTGVLSMVNAGHVAPYLCRDGATTAVTLPVDLPLGLFADTAYRSTEIPLRPGDRLVLVTDGMLERDAATLDVSAQITRTRTLHPREATRVLTDAVVMLSDGALADDATLMVLDWHGGHGALRRTTAGAEQGRTSPKSYAEGVTAAGGAAPRLNGVPDGSDPRT